MRKDAQQQLELTFWGLNYLQGHFDDYEFFAKL
jgi:hypothetical protein